MSQMIEISFISPPRPLPHDDRLARIISVPFNPNSSYCLRFKCI